MPTYVSLLNFTDQGVKDIKRKSQWAAEIGDRLEEL